MKNGHALLNSLDIRYGFQESNIIKIMIKYFDDTKLVICSHSCKNMLEYFQKSFKIFK